MHKCPDIWISYFRLVYCLGVSTIAKTDIQEKGGTNLRFLDVRLSSLQNIIDNIQIFAIGLCYWSRNANC